MRVDFDRYSLRLDGERKLIRSGSLHYFRLPAPELWWDRLEKMRAAGLNAVDLYYPWNYHSDAPGRYDFRDFRDVDRLHDMIEEIGLYLIARPGPYICSEIDFGGLPAWLLNDTACIPRCRSGDAFVYSRAFMHATREWFDQIVPRFASRPNLILVQVENEYTLPSPLGFAQNDLADLVIRWFGTRRALGWMRRFGSRGARRLRGASRLRGQTSPYMIELVRLMRARRVEVPIFHNDLSATTGRQMDVDVLGIDRYSVVDFSSDWRDRPATFDAFLGDETALDAHGKRCPQFYPELQGGWYDGWGGPGYERVRSLLGPESIDNSTKAALAERATLWNYFVFCGGVTWGYMSSPDVYTSYDYGAPLGESGRPGARYEAVRRLNAFLEQFEEELTRTDRIEAGERWCPEHLVTRQGPTHRFVFLRNPSPQTLRAPTPERERAELAPWETQIRVYGPERELVAVSPPPVGWIDTAPGTPPPLPRLERWTFSGASPQLEPGYDDQSWAEIAPERVERGAIDIDALGVHYGFVWYRGTFHGRLDRLILDARHCWAAWVNGRLVGAGDQFQNPLGVGCDGARMQRVALHGVPFLEGRNALVILVESLGHNKGFADDGAHPRGIVRLDTGATRVRWRFREGLVRGERGMNPIVAFEVVERAQAQEVVLPHGWAGEPTGIGLYQSSFRLEGIDPKQLSIGLSFDPGRGKSNLYLNGHLIGRYWPERGPQRRFLLPWGILHPDADNDLAITVWKRSPRAALGKVRLEPM